MRTSSGFYHFIKDKQALLTGGLGLGVTPALIAQGV